MHLVVNFRKLFFTITKSHIVVKRNSRIRNAGGFGNLCMWVYDRYDIGSGRVLGNGVRGLCVWRGVWKGYFVPEWPKPPAPRSVSSTSAVSTISGWVTGAITSWAILSPFFTSKSASPRLTRMTPTSPR